MAHHFPGTMPDHNLRLKGIRKLMLFGFFLLALLVLPAFIQSQWITGPLVNAILFSATMLIGPAGAALLCVLPSVAALSAGLLPAPLMPMLPFIVASNWILVAFFHYLRRKSHLMGVAIAAILKFVFLYTACNMLLIKALGYRFPDTAAAMMSWPQLATALAGGVIALGVQAAIGYPARKSRQ